MFIKCLLLGSYYSVNTVYYTASLHVPDNIYYDAQHINIKETKFFVRIIKWKVYLIQQKKTYYMYIVGLLK